MAAASTRLRVRVIPGSPSAGVVGRHGDAWKLRVTAPPERGRANEATLDVLARTLGVERADLRLVAGHAARNKTVEVWGLSSDEAERRLAP
jgi:uncharacterized protein (TIGR00251 family)